MNSRFAGVALIAIGMAGLYFKVDYSGWIVFLGAVLVI